ncbi:hypothetical protein FACS1894182_07120 [Bacteroidia bacterium]|nr:hypothetical protein FACS1894182_07120 [Bacteroidia bacterium]
MKKLDFEQMEVISGGKSCAVEAVVFAASFITSLGMTGFTAGLSWGLTAWAAKDYIMCQDGNIH